MLTVDKSQFLDQQKYFEADKFSTCDKFEQNYSQPYGLIKAFLKSLVLAHVQQGKSRRLAEVPSSSRLI